MLRARMLRNYTSTWVEIMLREGVGIEYCAIMLRKIVAQTLLSHEAKFIFSLGLTCCIN